jgi:rifampin ADP-ribosylating transferase
LKVIGEISEWKGHSSEALKSMRDNLSKLKEQGIEAINE